MSKFSSEPYFLRIMLRNTSSRILMRVTLSMFFISLKSLNDSTKVTLFSIVYCLFERDDLFCLFDLQIIDRFYFRDLFFCFLIAMRHFQFYAFLVCRKQFAFVSLPVKRDHLHFTARVFQILLFHFKGRFHPCR